MIKKTMIFLAVLLVGLLAVSSVSASEITNETMDLVSPETDDLIIESIDNSFDGDINDELVGDSIDSKTNDLSAVGESGSFTDLAREIDNAGSNLKLTKNYYYLTEDSDYKDGITIYKEITIDGNGFTIDGGNNSRAFKIISDNVVIKNLKFQNCMNYEFGGAIYWRGSNGILSNCSLNNCYIDSSQGGAIYWAGKNGSVINCNFNKCYVEQYLDDGYLSFIGGGAIYWAGELGKLDNSEFNNCHIYLKFEKTWSKMFGCQGGAVYWEGTYGTIINSNFLNNYIKTNSMQKICGGAVSFNSVDGIFKNCFFKNNYIRSGQYSLGGAVYATTGIYSSMFIKNSAKNGSAICLSHDGAKVRDSIFLSNSNLVICAEYGYQSTDAKYNWWGSDSKPNVGSKVDVSERLSCKITSNKKSLEVGETAIINIDFNNIFGFKSKYANSNLHDIQLIITSSDGSSNKLIIHNGVGVFNYVAKNTPNDSLTFNIQDSTEKTVLNFVISKGKTNLISSNVNPFYNSGDYVVATLNDNYGHNINNAPISISFNGKTFNSTTDNLGKIKLNIKGLLPKAYSVSIDFNGDNDYLKSSATFKFTIKKETPKLIVSKKTFDVNSKIKKYTISLKDNNGKAITNRIVKLKIKGNVYKAKTNSKGQATFKITKLTKTGEYATKVIFDANNIYNGVTKSTKITVKKTIKKSTKKTNIVTLSAKYKWVTLKKGKYVVKSRLWKVSSIVMGDYNDVDIVLYKNGKQVKSSQYLSTYKYKENGKWKWANWRHGKVNHMYHRYSTNLLVNQIKVKWVVA